MKRLFRIALVLGLALLAFSLLFGGPSAPTIEAGSTLVIPISGSYVEATEAPLISALLGETRQPFVGLLSRFAMVKRDDRISTVVLRMGSLGVGWGKAQELRAAIGRLRAAGRRVVAHIQVEGMAGSREFYIASAADEIYLAHGTNIPLVGLAAEYLHLGGLWDKLGIDLEAIGVGKYKSAVEVLAGEGMSEAAREMANSLLDSVYDQFVAGIAQGRGKSDSEVRAAIDSGPVLASELVHLGLIDGVQDWRSLVDGIDAPVVESEDYARVDAASVGFEPVARVALIYGAGNVMAGGEAPTGGSRFAADTATEALLAAADDPEIDAIVLRIDSPGGSAMASEQIWQAITRAREEGNKPIVASFSDVAASGGYYVATAADAIVSSPAALTGSIGVYMLRPGLGDVLDKLGIHVESLTRGRHADFGLSAQPISDGTRARLKQMALETYRLFSKRVADGRSLDAERVEAIAQGRVWTGEQALEAGLVDALGGLHTAVALLRTRLELDEDADVALMPYPEQPSLSEQIGSLLEGRVQSLAAILPTRGLGSVPALASTLEGWLSDLPLDAPLLIPPLLVDIR